MVDMHKALYRVYRPKNFSDVIGQEHIVRTLKNQIENNNVGHAYLFCGTRGTGKTSTAKIFSRAVNCTNLHNDEPCNECENLGGYISEFFPEKEFILWRGFCPTHHRITAEDIIKAKEEHPNVKVLSHPELNVSTNRDLKKFMEKATTNEFKQLSVLSQDYHIHTIEVSNKDIFEEIKKELRDKNILFE